MFTFSMIGLMKREEALGGFPWAITGNPDTSVPDRDIES